MPSIHRSITPRTVVDATGGDPSIAPNTFIRDTAIPGFAILLGRSKSSYVIEGRQGRGGRNVRFTLGTVGRMSLDEARSQAREKVAELARGRNPVAELRSQRMAAITAGEALQLLIENRKPRPVTIKGYRRALTALGWTDRALAKITSADVVAAYNGMREHHSTAALTFRAFRAIWNAARAENPTLPECPTSALRHVAKRWATAPRKRSVIPDSALAQWRKQVAALEREDVRDLLLFLLYSGCRIAEARALTVDRVNLRARSFTLEGTKAGNSVDLPITKQLAPILKRRVAAVGNGALWPFGDVRKSHASVDVCAWTYHDLRRGYITQAHRLGVDDVIARALTNHANPDGDAHSGYVVLTPDTLRPEAQRIADALDK